MIYAYLIPVAVVVVVTLIFAAYNYVKVRKMSPGTETMQEIASAIQEGASAFIAHEYKIIAVAAVAIAVVLGMVVSWYTGVSFLLGTIMSALAGAIGMKIATIANVRVSNEARETKNLGKTMKVAFRGGSVMGLCAAGLGLLGLIVVYFVFGILLKQTNPKISSLSKTQLVFHLFPLRCPLPVTL